MRMAAGLGASSLWSVSLAPSQYAFRGKLAIVSSSSSHVIVSRPLAAPRLLTDAAAASQVVADTPPPPPLPAPPSPSSSSSSSSAEDEEGGPIRLPDSQEPFALPSDGISPLQSAASVLLTGIIAVLLYRSLRRRIKLSKETKVRSTGLENIREEGKEAEKAETSMEKVLAPVVRPPPSAWQTFQGAVVAGAIAFVLYKFTTYVEAGVNSKPVSSVYTIRQLTITVRTIVNGMCYLATFVFAANSIGLTLYTLQLLFGSGPKETTEKMGDSRLTDQDSLQTDSLEDVKKE